MAITPLPGGGRQRVGSHRTRSRKEEREQREPWGWQRGKLSWKPHFVAAEAFVLCESP